MATRVAKLSLERGPIKIVEPMLQCLARLADVDDLRGQSGLVQTRPAQEAREEVYAGKIHGESRAIAPGMPWAKFR